MSGFHECEIKMKINNEIKTGIEKSVVRQGYTRNGSWLETDYVLDTPELVLDKNLFRVREISNGESKQLLYTFKCNGRSANFQEFNEYETTPGTDGADILVQLVRENSEIELDAHVFDNTELNDALAALLEKGFIIKRCYQKKRDEFLGSDSKVLFDTFPEPVGIYIEIETTSEEKLKSIIEKLGMDKCDLEVRNYGQIIREATRNKNRLMFE